MRTVGLKKKDVFKKDNMEIMKARGRSGCASIDGGLLKSLNAQERHGQEV